MRTFILKWNPADGNYSAEQFRNDLEEIADGGTIEMNWTVADYVRQKNNDRFFMIREGRGNNGVAMAGYFSSHTFIDDEWEGEGTRHVANIDPLVWIDIDEAPFVSLDELKASIPDFSWEDVPSGTLIEDCLAAKLEHIWLRYLYEHQDIFDGGQAAKSWDFDLEDFESVPPTLQVLLKERYGCTCERCHKDEKEVVEMAYHVILDDYNPEAPKPLNSHLHCLCNECWFGT